MMLLLKKLIDYIKDYLISLSLIKGQNDYTKFIILSDYRSGSNLLMNLIKSHPNAHCYSELFYGKKIFWASKVYGKSETNSKALSIRKKSPLIFLDKYCFRKYTKSIQAVGFKLMYFDLFKNKSIDLKNLLSHYPGLKIIHLKRRNYLERFVSDKMVKLTGEAVAVDKSDWEKASIKANKVTIEATICEDDFKWREQMENELADAFSHSTNLRITVYYEDLNINKITESNRVIEFLNLTPIKLETKQIKQNTKKLSDRIENFEELKAHFKNTKWESFFNE
jgi:LPS sulfotransferase NodH